MRTMPHLAPRTFVRPRIGGTVDQGLPTSDDLLQELADHGIAAVSFDVFGTVLVRLLPPDREAGDLAARLAGRPELAAARRRARYRLQLPVGGDVPLVQRWAAVVAATDAEALTRQEGAVEQLVCRARPGAVELVAAVVAAGYPIAFTSDTPLAGLAVRALLDHAGVPAGPVLTSADHEVTKAGGLLVHTARWLRLPPQQILHLGDDPRADVEPARSLGMHPWLVSTSAPGRAVPAKLLRDPLADDLARGLIAHRLPPGCPGSGPGSGERSGSWSGGDAATLGYVALGPLLWSFTRWVLARAVRDRIDHLVFLARDGHLPHQACAIIARHHPDLPRLTYAWASRRALAMASLHTPSEALAVAGHPPGDAPLGSWLAVRLDLDRSTIVAACATVALDPDQPIARRDQLRLHRLITALAPALQHRAEERRQQLTRYYRDLGLAGGDGRAAVVDIGHHGTLQRDLHRLLGCPIGGYYLATMADCSTTAAPAGRARGFLVHDGIGRWSRIYRRHLSMSEFAFQDFRHGSLLRLEPQPGAESWWPVTLPPPCDDTSTLLDALGRGALAFVEDFEAQLHRAGHRPSVRRGDGAAAWFGMLRDPAPDDARLFLGMGLEREWNGAGLAPLIARPGERRGSWSEGERVIRRPGSRPARLPTDTLLDRTPRVRKLVRAPHRFFADAKLPLLRPLRHLFRP